MNLLDIETQTPISTPMISYKITTRKYKLKKTRKNVLAKATERLNISKNTFDLEKLKTVNFTKKVRGITTQLKETMMTLSKNTFSNTWVSISIKLEESVGKRSPLLQLYPFVDDGVIEVCGKLTQYKDLAEDQCNQLVEPKKSQTHLTGQLSKVFSCCRKYDAS